MMQGVEDASCDRKTLARKIKSPKGPSRRKDHIYADGNVVIVQLALQGTHDGPLQLPFGDLPATGKKMDAPCCDVFELEDGKIKRFDSLGT
jgi:ketosteroid isomerase-like protein